VGSDPGRGQTPYFLALFLAALTLRPQLVGIGPLLPAIQRDLGVSHAVAGLLTTIPVLCMGVFALPARHLSQRIGLRAAVTFAVVGVAVAGVIRPVPDAALAIILLTVPIGVGMGIAGAILPVVVKERFATRPGFATAVYTTGIAMGATLAAAFAVPLAHAMGSWRWSLALFGGVSVFLSAGWVALTRGDPKHRRPEEPPLRLPFRSGVAWHLVAAFVFMSIVFYGINTWLPATYVAHGWSQGSAGALLAVLNAITIPCGFAVAWVADHRGSRAAWLTACASLQLVGLIGILASPDAGWLWAVVLGVAIGPLFPLTMTLPLDVGAGPAEAAAYTAMMLGAGYTASALGPLLLGVVRDQTGSFTPVIWCLAACSALLVVTDGTLRLTLARSK
jgi:MFS transporter, CP family, cyanate transporter